MMTAQEALDTLMIGNRRFAEEHLKHPHQDQHRRAEIVGGQHPFAVVLTCSDSRVAPEVIFDQGLGDLFVIRVAGNVSDDIVLASIEYAAAHLGTALVMVLGHQNCGAITAALAGGSTEGALPYLMRELQPAVEQTECCDVDPLDTAIRANARIVAEKLLATSEVLAGLVETDALKIVPALYQFDTGKVELL